jgi:hypothetical protein
MIQLAMEKLCSISGAPSAKAEASLQEFPRTSDSEPSLRTFRG